MLPGQKFFYVCACVLLFFANKRADSRSVQVENGSFKQLFNNAKVEEKQMILKQNGGVHNNTATNRAMTEVIHVNDNGGVQLNRSVTYPEDKVIVKIINCNGTEQTNQKSESTQHETTQKGDLDEINNDYHDNSQEYHHYYNEMNENTPTTGDRQSFVSLLQLITSILAENLGLAKNSTLLPRPLVFLPGISDDGAVQKKLHDTLVKILEMVKTPMVSYEAQQLLQKLKEKIPGLPPIVGNNVQQHHPIAVPFVQISSPPGDVQMSVEKLIEKYPLLGLLRNNGRVQQYLEQQPILLSKLTQMFPQLTGVQPTIPQPNPIAVHKTLEQILEDEIETFKKVVKDKTQIPDQKKFNKLLTTVATLLKPLRRQTFTAKATPPTLMEEALLPHELLQVYDLTSKSHYSGRPSVYTRHHKRRKYCPIPVPCPRCPSCPTNPNGDLLKQLLNWIKQNLQFPSLGGCLSMFSDSVTKNAGPYSTPNIPHSLNLQGIGGGAIPSLTNILRSLVNFISTNLGSLGKTLDTPQKSYASNPLLLSRNSKPTNIKRVCTEYVYNNYPQTRPLLQNTLERNRYKRSLQNSPENLLQQFSEMVFPLTTTKTNALEILGYLPKFLEFVRKSLDWLSDDKNIQEYKAYFYMPMIFGVVVGVVSGATMVGFKILTDTIKSGVTAMNPSNK